MKVTIISNGTHQLVLKPETPVEKLAIKELQNKPLVSKYHESTQILGESSPNCLVIRPGVDSDAPLERELIALVDNYSQNQILALIPAETSYPDILYLIKNITKADKVVLTKNESITINEVFMVIATKDNVEHEGQYAVISAPTMTSW